jgi:hypothetical protein
MEKFHKKSVILCTAGTDAEKREPAVDRYGKSMGSCKQGRNA